ncbi:conserved hypothetical protein [Wolbachia endosymbiont of Drosophila ananassae]|nr:conserved hypothetical protein [Wolbachia endosymbiont of Drosophila ananassae]
MVGLLFQLYNKVQSIIDPHDKKVQPIVDPRDKNATEGISQEKLIVQEVSKDECMFDNNPEVQYILSDFDNLDFSNGPFNYSLYDINYNEGKEANPFDKIAKYYGRKKNVFLFISMLQNSEQLEKIINIIGEKCNAQDRKKFTERLNIYLGRIREGDQDAKELLNGDFPGAFFNGPHIGKNRNIHQNLNIKIKPGQTLEVSSLFNKKSELEREKIYNEKGQRIATIEKNEKQQRNYSFTKFAIRDTEISWGAKDESEKGLNCAVVLNINLGQVSIKKSTIDGKDVEPKKILELTKQNEAVLIKGKALHEVLAAHFIKQTPCEEKENIQPHENIIVPDSGAPSSAIDEKITVEHPFGKAANKMDREE